MYYNIKSQYCSILWIFFHSKGMSSINYKIKIKSLKSLFNSPGCYGQCSTPKSLLITNKFCVNWVLIGYSKSFSCICFFYLISKCSIITKNINVNCGHIFNTFQNLPVILKQYLTQNSHTTNEQWQDRMQNLLNNMTLHILIIIYPQMKFIFTLFSSSKKYEIL